VVTSRQSPYPVVAVPIITDSAQSSDSNSVLSESVSPLVLMPQTAANASRGLFQITPGSVPAEVRQSAVSGDVVHT